MNKKQDVGLIGAIVICTVALLLKHLFKLSAHSDGSKRHERLKAGVPGA